MTGKKWKGAVCLAFLAAFCAGFIPVDSGAQSRFRELDRLLEDRDLTAGEQEVIAGAYGSARKAGQDRRDTLDLVEFCLEADFEPAQVARALSIYAQLELSNLPEEDFLSKIREGVAKRVPTEKILAAAGQQALLIKRAENVVNALILAGYDVGDREEILFAVAEALESGKGEGEIRRILTTALDEGVELRKVRKKLLR